MRPEERIELKFVAKCKEELGIDAYKFEIKGKKGPPDRILFMPRATTILIEFKRPDGGELSEHQIKFIGNLTNLGFKVLVTDSVEEAMNFVKENLYDNND